MFYAKYFIHSYHIVFLALQMISFQYVSYSSKWFFCYKNQNKRTVSVKHAKEMKTTNVAFLFKLFKKALDNNVHSPKYKIVLVWATIWPINSHLRTHSCVFSWWTLFPHAFLRLKKKAVGVVWHDTYLKRIGGGRGGKSNENKMKLNTILY